MGNNRLRRRSQAINGGIILVVIMAITTFIVISQRMQNQYDNIMSFALDNKADLISSEVDDYFEPMRIVQALNEEVWNTKRNFYFEAISLEPFISNLVDLYPQLNSIFFGDKEGNFAMYYKEESGEIHTKIVLNHTVTPETIWRYFKGGKIDRITRLEYADFDPRTRPWYIGAINTSSFFLTEPYEFFTAKVQGITASHVIYDTEGEIWGSLGMDIKIADLKEYLMEINLLGNGHAFVVTSQNQIIFPDEDSIDIKEQ